MRFRPSVVLRAFSLWTVWVWVVLIRNMVVDHNQGVAFRLVHIGLALISIAFAVSTWKIASFVRRAERAGIPLRRARGTLGPTENDGIELKQKGRFARLR